MDIAYRFNYERNAVAVGLALGKSVKPFLLSSSNYITPVLTYYR